MLPGISCDQFSGTETRYGIIAHGWKRNWVHRWVNWWKHLSRHFTLLSSVEYLIKHSQWISQAAKLFINCASALRCFLASFYVDWKSSPPLLSLDLRRWRFPRKRLQSPWKFISLFHRMFAVLFSPFCWFNISTSFLVAKRTLLKTVHKHSKYCEIFQQGKMFEKFSSATCKATAEWTRKQRY